MTCIHRNDIKKATMALAKEHLSLGNFHTKYDTTEKRVQFLSQYFGSEEEAKFFNNKFERYLLTQQKARMKAWLESSKEGIDTSTKKTLLDKIDAIATPLQANNTKMLLNGLVEQKLGFGLTQEETKDIINKNNNIKNAKTKLLKVFPEYTTTWATTQQGMEIFEAELKKELAQGSGAILDYGKAVVEMKKLYDNAKIRADKQKRLTAETKVGRAVKKVKEAGIYAAGLLKSLKASFDISFGRQLSSAMFLKGGIKGELQGLKVMKDFFTGKLTEQQRDTLDMMIYVRPNSVNGNYTKLGVAVGIQEEAYPETFVSKGGRFNPFMASEVSFTNAIQTARANIADALIIQADGDMGLLKTQKAGEFVNMITGRGVMPVNKPETERFINAALFSPRWLMSRIQLLADLPTKGLGVLTGQYKKGDPAHMIDRQRGLAAIRQLMFFTALPMLLKGVSRAMRKDEEYGDDEWERIWSAFNATSSDFGKLVWGDTRVDTTFGYAALITTAARVLTGKKTTLSGVEKKVGAWDVIGTFFQGKASPLVRSVVDGYIGLTEGEGAKDFMYQPITFSSWLKTTFPPITLENLYEAFTTDTENKTAQWTGFALDFIGVGANTYGVSTIDTGKSPELKKLEKILARTSGRAPTSLAPSKQSNIVKQLSGERQKKAIDEYSRLYNQKATRLVKSYKFKNMSPEEQSDALKAVRSEVNKTIKKKYNIKDSKGKKKLK